jgi:hypothetical protein
VCKQGCYEEFGDNHTQSQAVRLLKSKFQTDSATTETLGMISGMNKQEFA